MDLQFQKEGNVWVAAFEATSDFNLHLERVENGAVKVLQSGTQGGEYDVAFTRNIYEGEVFDYDFGALVYPKYIKVTSGSEVIRGVVTFSE